MNSTIRRRTTTCTRMYYSLLVSFLLLFIPKKTSSTTAFSVSTTSTMSPTITTTAATKTSSSSLSSSSKMITPPPIVYTIAGSDSGGGAGIQADLHAIHSMGCHGCSAITCLTAQSSTGVTGVHTPPIDFLRLQLDTLTNDLYPRAIKIGMLGSKELALEVGMFLKRLKEEGYNNRGEKDDDDEKEAPFVVLDPVMISTSGHKLIEDDAKQTIIQSVFPYVDIVTPNKFEAEEILGRKLSTPQDVEDGAKEIIQTMGAKAVLIKGGHSLVEEVHSSNDGNVEEKQNGNSLGNGPLKDVTLGYAQDYFLSSEGPLTEGKERICDGSRGVWLRAKR